MFSSSLAPSRAKTSLSTDSPLSRRSSASRASRPSYYGRRDDGPGESPSFFHIIRDSARLAASPVSQAAWKQNRAGLRIHEVKLNDQWERTASKREYPDYLDAFGISSKARKLMQSKLFEWTSAFLVILNAIEMGVVLAYPDEIDHLYYLGVECLFAGAFLLETLTILIGVGHRAFFDAWLFIQLFSTAAAVGDVSLQICGLEGEYTITSQTLRCSRLLLLGKILTLNTETRLIAISMARSLKSLQGVLIVIMVVCYCSTLLVYSIVGREGDRYDDKGIDFNGMSHELYFGNITRTMLTLFSVLILSEWDSVARGVYDVQPYFVPFFFVFTTFTTFGLLNVLVGIIVDTVNTLHHEHEEELREAARLERQHHVEEIVEIVFGDDNDITLDEFLDITENQSEIAQLMHDFQVPWGFTFADLFNIIDDDKDGHMTKGELADGLFSLMAGDDTARFCLAQNSVSKSHTDIVNIAQKLEKMATQQNIIAAAVIKDKMSGSTSRPTTSGPSKQSESDGEQTTDSAHLSASLGMAVAFEAPLQPSKEEESIRPPERKLPEVPKTEVATSDLWEQCYENLRATVKKHCKNELDRAWESLRQASKDREPTGTRIAPDRTPNDTIQQEYYVIRNKLHNAVCQESTNDLRKAIDHAIIAGVDSSLLTIELTYNDALRRSKAAPLPVSEVKEAMERGDWSAALDNIVDSAISYGADKSILASLITRVAADSSLVSGFASNAPKQVGRPLLSLPNAPGRLGGTSDADVAYQQLGGEILSSPLPSGLSGNSGSSEAEDRALALPGRVGFIRKFAPIRTKQLKESGQSREDSGSEGKPSADSHSPPRLLAVLHSEASRHTSQEMNKAWAALESTNRPTGGLDSTPPQLESPFSKAESLFFVHNQLYSAVHRKSLIDLQRALNHAVVAGVDVRNMEEEIAYRDALARYLGGTAHTVRLAVDAFRRKEWYLALDLVIQVSLACGADRLTLIRALTKMYSRTSS